MKYTLNKWLNLLQYIGNLSVLNIELQTESPNQWETLNCNYSGLYYKPGIVLVIFPKVKYSKGFTIQ